MKIAYLNDEYLPLEQARVSALDRGFLFADGVYEVIPVYGGRLFRLDQHLDRLDGSLGGIRLANPLSRPQWRAVLARLVDMNGGGEQSVYFQVTRGAAAKRDHLFPASVPQTVFAMSSPLKAIDSKWLQEGATAITIPDIRWQYCHLKTISLLPNVLMRQLADDSGADEAILIRDGLATECTVSNLFIVKEGVIVTPPKSEYLLPGITRDLLLELAHRHGMPARERAIPETELAAADEIWITSSSKEVIPATHLNGRKVGDGRPGPVWRRMFDHYQEYKNRLIAGDAE
ncbi:MAG TPA: D-amino acid aminotransferase [Gammaproteobacteria bacterium]|nr:D-amino acid aminotransferase [Gammaproteobacteria bacterium]